MVAALREVPRQTRLKPVTNVVAVVISALSALIRPHKAALSNLLHMPLTVIGYSCVSVGVFTASVIAGWIVTGLLLIVLELQVADE